MELGKGSVLTREAQSQLRCVPLLTQGKDALMRGRWGRLLDQDPESAESNGYIGFPQNWPKYDWQVIFLICVSLSPSVKGTHSLKIKKTFRGSTTIYDIIISMNIGGTFVGGSHGQDSIRFNV